MGRHSPRADGADDEARRCPPGAGGGHGNFLPTRRSHAARAPTGEGKNHATAAKELRTALAKRDSAAIAEKALRELIAAKGDIEYVTALISAAKAEPLARRARSLVELATEIVRIGR